MSIKLRKNKINVCIRKTTCIYERTSCKIRKRREKMAAKEGKTKYYTLMETLKSKIQSGTLSPGDKLPSENQLAEEYGLSRHTVRKALNLLAGGRLHLFRTGPRDLLLREAPPYETVSQYRGSDHLYYGLHFPKADPGHGSRAFLQRLQHYSEKYRQQPETGSPGAGRHPEERCGRG